MPLPLTRLAVATLFATGVSCAFAAAPQTAASKPSGATATAPAQPGALAQVLRMDNIGRRIDIFERAAGAPVDARENWSSYLVESCPVEVTTKNGMVEWISIEFIGAGCRVDLQPLISVSRVLAADAPITFGEFEAIQHLQAQYIYPCGGMNCGNAFEPTLDAVFPGARVNNFVDVVGSSRFTREGDFDVLFAWKREVQKQFGDDDAFENFDMECDRRFDALSRQRVADLRLDTIAFGHRPPQANGCRE